MGFGIVAGEVDCFYRSSLGLLEQLSSSMGFLEHLSSKRIGKVIGITNV